ncbi:MAG: hypothetical protein ACHQ1D_02350 [Nitrososphaerales archaeon]
MKNIYALQPYQVGSKNAKSLAIVIPAKVVKKFHIDTSTIFTLEGDDNTKKVTLQTICGLSQSLIYTPTAGFKEPVQAKSEGD